MEYRRYLYEQAHGKNAAVPRSTLSRWNKEKRVAQSANDPCNAMEEESATGPEIASNLTDNEDDVALSDLEENEVDIEGDNNTCPRSRLTVNCMVLLTNILQHESNDTIRGR